MDNREIIPGWELVEKIGSGGFSTVYKIRKSRSAGAGEYCAALKVIKIPNTPDEYENYAQEGYDHNTITSIFENQVKKLEEEFHLMSRFKGNSNIVSYEDHMIIPHDDEKGWDIYIRMELLEPLTKYYNQKPLDEKETVKLGVDICRALEICQRFNVIHRDIKPQNIFVNDLGDYKLGDFGIARTMDHTTHATKIGTYTYIAPEVYRGDAYNSDVDIYSLGLVLYWLLNERRLPFLPLPPSVPNPTEISEATGKRLSGEMLPPPKNGSENLKEIVLKACAFNSADRYQSATEFRMELEKELIALASTSRKSSETEVSTSSIKDEKTVSVSSTSDVKSAPKSEPTDDATVGFGNGKSLDNSDKQPISSSAFEVEKTMPLTFDGMGNNSASGAKPTTGNSHSNKNTVTENKGNKKSKKTLIILLIIAIVAIAVGVVVFLGNGNNSKNTGGNENSYDITIWVPDNTNIADLFQKQIDEFNAANPNTVINACIQCINDAEAGGKVTADVATAPDIYCFAQDQLARLVKAGALAAPNKTVADIIKANNDTGSVAAATVAGQLYAYPMTSDNGYFMYYDKSIISEKDAESLEKIIEKCEANGKKIYFNIEDAWYTSSFFFATGCHSEWTMDDDGNFIGIYDNFNSAEGLIAMKGMSKLSKSSCYTNDANTFTDIAVIISGIWEANAASAYYGNNLAATDLPSFEVDGKSYHLGSYSGNKLLGVKPQADAKRTAVLSELAQYLTGEECQRERYESFQWGSSNKTVQGSEAVQSNIFLSALAKQNKYGVPQGQIDGSWWDIAKVLGTKARIAKNDNELKLALNEYESAVNAIFKKTNAEKNAWGVIGNICNTNWDTDFPMTEGPTGTFTSDVLELKAGEEFKVRKGASWDVNFGDEFNGANIVVKADGKYKVQFVWNGDKVGKITLIPTE